MSDVMRPANDGSGCVSQHEGCGPHVVLLLVLFQHGSVPHLMLEPLTQNVAVLRHSRHNNVITHGVPSGNLFATGASVAGADDNRVTTGALVGSCTTTTGALVGGTTTIMGAAIGAPATGASIGATTGTAKGLALGGANGASALGAGAFVSVVRGAGAATMVGP
jgi:hypothetical protein